MRDVMKGPKNVFQNLHSQMNKLSLKLAQEQEKSTEVVHEMKAGFEKNLTKEKKHNDDIMKANVGLESDINSLQADSKKLRSKAMELRQENRDLIADLRLIQNNVTTVIEFTANALNQSHEMLEVAPELHVLTELATKDEVSKKDRDHKKRLLNVAKGKSFSLLQVASRSASQDPSGVLATMNEALTQLENEENASKANLTASFDRDFQELMGGRADLLKEQEQLNTTKNNAIELKKKLTSAMDHLTASHKTLTQQAKSTRKFAEKLSGRPLPKSPLSLLQTSAETHGQKVLPGVAAVMSKPKAIFSKMNNHVNNLEGRLAEVQTQNLEEISKQKRKYEANLTTQKEYQHKIERGNKVVKLDIQHLHQSIGRLRSAASDLEKKNVVLVADLKKVQANITTAEEFTAQALNSSDEMLYNAPEIAVLTELAKKDEAMGSENDHHKRLKEIGDATSLLQFSKGADPKNLLEIMTNALTELSQEQSASEISLKESFLAEYAEGEEKTEALLKQQDELNATKVAAIELQDQLAEAVEHLQNTHHQLKERSSSLHAFAARLGGKAMPKAKGLS